MADNGAKKKLLSTTDRQGLCLSVHAMAGADKPQRGVCPVVAAEERGSSNTTLLS